MRKSISDWIVIFIYANSYVFALALLRYQLLLSPAWDEICKISAYGILMLCVFYVCFENKLLVNKWMLLLGVFVLYEIIITIFTISDLHPGYLAREIITWPFLAFVFCDFGRKRELPRELKPITYFGMSLLYVFSIPNIVVHLGGDGRFGGVIGPIYFLFSFLPMVFLICDIKSSYILSLISFILILLSTKRAGLLIVVSGISFVYLINGYKNRNIRKVLKRCLTLIAFGCGGYFLLSIFDAAVLVRMNKIGIDGGSGRITIWKTVMREFFKSTNMKKIFGHGFHAVSTEMTFFGRQVNSHNSFMEILYDYGIVGLFVLIVIIIWILNQEVFLIRQKDYRALALGFSIPVVLILGLLGYFFEESHIIIPISIAWGLCMYKKKDCISTFRGISKCSVKQKREL